MASTATGWTALVTGGASGLGKATVELLHKTGYNVVVSYTCTREDAAASHPQCEC